MFSTTCGLCLGQGLLNAQREEVGEGKPRETKGTFTETRGFLKVSLPSSFEGMWCFLGFEDALEPPLAWVRV